MRNPMEVWARSMRKTGNPIDAHCITKMDLSIRRGRGCLMGLRDPDNEGGVGEC